MWQEEEEDEEEEEEDEEEEEEDDEENDEELEAGEITISICDADAASGRNTAGFGATVDDAGGWSTTRTTSSPSSSSPESSVSFFMQSVGGRVDVTVDDEDSGKGASIPATSGTRAD